MKANNLAGSDVSYKKTAPFPLFTSLVFIAMAVSISLLSLVLLHLPIDAQTIPTLGLDPLNPQLTNSIDAKGGPTLYYNGSGDVPP